MKKIDIWNDLTKLYEDSSSYVSGLSQLDHALQAADAARRSGADSETIVAALLHDGKSVSSRTYTHSFKIDTQTTNIRMETFAYVTVQDRCESKEETESR